MPTSRRPGQPRPARPRSSTMPPRRRPGPSRPTRSTARGRALDVAEPEPVVVDPDATSATLAPRRSSLSRPLPWLAVGAGLLLAALFTFAYVGAFVDPIDELRDLKIGVVDLDQPVTVAGQSIDVGGDVLAATAADTTAAVAWTPFASREEVIAALEDNELAGAVILPADLSQRVAAIGTALGAAPQAAVEVLRNPGAGSLQPAVVDQAAAALVAQLNATVAQRLSTTLTGARRPGRPGERDRAGDARRRHVRGRARHRRPRRSRAAPVVRRGDDHAHRARRGDRRAHRGRRGGRPGADRGDGPGDPRATAARPPRLAVLAGGGARRDPRARRGDRRAGRRRRDARRARRPAVPDRCRSSRSASSPPGG